MKKKTCSIRVDNKPYSFEVDGDFFWGTEEEPLYKEEDNVISKCSWKGEGYSVVKAFNQESFFKLKESVKKNIFKALNSVANLNLDEAEFNLEDYHKYVTDETHYKVINITRNLENTDFNFNIDSLVEQFGRILGYQLTSWIKGLGKTHIQIRISRPQSLDINPPHRDSYLSYYYDIINIWIPISGCNEHSSLPVFPKSHLIPEINILRTKSKGAKINGNIYYVPCILETKEGDIEMVRPNPKPTEALIFTPFLIHGAASNNNEDITRISLELRFPKATNSF